MREVLGDDKTTSKLRWGEPERELWMVIQLELHMGPGRGQDKGRREGWEGGREGGTEGGRV